MERFKRYLFSERGMKFVNLLFLFAILLRGSGLLSIAYLVWGAYLFHGVRTAPSRAMRIVSGVFLVFACGMLLLDFCFLAKSL